MDRGTMHGIATILAMIAFLSICWWAFKPSNRKRFEADGQLAIDTDPIHGTDAKQTPKGDKK